MTANAVLRNIRPLSGARVLARYRLEHELGGGGMGVVYRAVDATLGRPVATEESDTDAWRIENFDRTR